MTLITALDFVMDDPKPGCLNQGPVLLRAIVTPPHGSAEEVLFSLPFAGTHRHEQETALGKEGSEGPDRLGVRLSGCVENRVERDDRVNLELARTKVLHVASFESPARHVPHRELDLAR